MTFKDLQKLVQSQSGVEQNKLLQRLKDKPFWIWNHKQHKRKISKLEENAALITLLAFLERMEWKSRYSIMKNYFMILFLSQTYNPMQHTFKLKHLWVKKATGLGVTEFFLRFMAWLCLKDNSYRNSQM